MSAQEVAEALGGAKRKNGGGFMARCPAHEDRNPSLSVDEKDGGLMVKCFAGCDQDAVVDALKSRNLWPTPEKLPPLPPRKPRVVAEFVFTDAGGNEIYRKQRTEPGRNGRKKEFKFLHGEKTGRGCDPVLYRLHEILGSETVYIVEGEAKADLLSSWGLAATSLDSGASGKLRPEMVEQLGGKNIIILPDNDGPGRQYAQRLVQELFDRAKSIKVVELPDLPEKGDINDWRQQGGNFEKFKEIVSNCNYIETSEVSEFPPIGTETGKLGNRLEVLDVFDFLRRELPPRETIMAPWLPAQGLAMVYAPRGVGKTHFSLGTAYAVASGGTFLRWKVEKPRGVLLLDGEMPAAVLQERLARIALSSDQEPQAPLRIVTPDLQPDGMIDLTRPEDQEQIEPYLKDVELIVVDNISTLCRTGRENEAEGWLPVQSWALAQRAAGRSVLFVHHSGKGGNQRGTSRREDVLDTVVALRRPGDYSPDQGAVFEIHFDKARGFHGDDTKPFEARLTTDGDRQTWAMRDVEDSLTEKVADALNEGVPQNELAELLGVAKGTVSKHKKKAQQAGMLK